MPLILNSSYQYKGILKNQHLQTIIPHLFRKRVTTYERERITTPDNDFLDLDWNKCNSKTLCILLHGLESSSSANYVQGMVNALHAGNIDSVAMNYRGCSGNLNLQPYAYHSGKTEDIDHVLRHVISTCKYQEIYLIGFSIGGNMTLKYLGEKGSSLSPLIKKAAVISCPIDLESTSNYFNLRQNWFYLNNFIKSFTEKLRQKAEIFPDQIDLKKVNRIKNFWDLDNYYTGPFHGFRDAKHYYDNVSAKFYLEGINIPTLFITAENDPFLCEENYPRDIAKNHKYIFLEITKDGGHLGFPASKGKGIWFEERILNFLKGVSI